MRECESALGLLASRRPAAPRRRSADGFALPRSALPVKQGAQGAGSSAAAEEARSERPLVKFTSRLLLMRFGSGRLSQGRIKTLRGRQFIRGGLVTGDSSPDIGVLWPQGVVVVGPGSSWSGGPMKGGCQERHLPWVHRPRPVTPPRISAEGPS